MPFGLLTKSVFFPSSFESLLPKATQLTAPPHGFCVWETLAQLPANGGNFPGTPGIFDNLFVIEGIPGLIISEGKAKSLNLKNGQNVKIYVGTHDEITFDREATPSKRLRVDVDVVVRKDELSEDSEVIMLGAKDLFKANAFNLFDDGRIIVADENGDFPDLFDRRQHFTKYQLVIQRSETAPECLPNNTIGSLVASL
jgi:hypothetical protein